MSAVASSARTYQCVKDRECKVAVKPVLNSGQTTAHAYPALDRGIRHRPRDRLLLRPGGENLCGRWFYRGFHAAAVKQSPASRLHLGSSLRSWHEEDAPGPFADLAVGCRSTGRDRLDNARDYPILRSFVEIGMHGQTQYFGSDSFACRQPVAGDREVFIGIPQMKRLRIVDRRQDALAFKALAMASAANLGHATYIAPTRWRGSRESAA